MSALLLPHDIHGDLHGRERSAVLQPVHRVPILGPAHAGTVFRSDPVAMVRDRSLQDVDDAWSVDMIVDRAEDSTRFHGHQAHAKLAPCHALDLGSKVDRLKQFHRNTFRSLVLLFVAHRARINYPEVPP